MSSSPDRRQRTTCDTCDLPYYADQESCPYCDAAGAGDPEASGFVFGNGDEGADRTTCPDCGLPHYADAHGCPYCTYAGHADDEEAAPAETPRQRPTDDRAATDSPTGLFGRLKAALGF